ncbi:hypothetical protein [Streptosporangium roseum]|uniref:hypothetical protein n=1 Tax=Streptosporangium roseum TaxID=2001 RepID=UPI00332C063D
MSGGMLVYTPGLQHALLRWLWGRPGPAGGWQLHLPGAGQEQVLRPPRRGLDPQQIGDWMDEILPAHGWQRAEPTSWPPSTLPRLVTQIPVIPAQPQPKIG